MSKTSSKTSSKSSTGSTKAEHRADWRVRHPEGTGTVRDSSMRIGPGGSLTFRDAAGYTAYFPAYCYTFAVRADPEQEKPSGDGTSGSFAPAPPPDAVAPGAYAHVPDEKVPGP